MPAELRSTRELAGSFNKQLPHPKGTCPVALRAIATIPRTVAQISPKYPEAMSSLIGTGVTFSSGAYISRSDKGILENQTNGQR